MDNDLGQFLADLKTRANIKDVVGSYVQLRRSGSDWVCCCPFHNEKTPSMYVHERQRYFHCFGCGKGGDVITFVRDIEGMSYMDAVKKLADQYHMTMPEFKADPEHEKKKERKDVLQSIMLEANRYYYNNLVNKEDGKPGLAYLESRGFGKDIVDKYRLGVSLSEDGLQRYLRLKKYNVADLQACGLVSGQNNTDFFANRLIVPILDPNGKVVAFGGRIYKEEDKGNPAKYKNSNTNEVFEKGRCIYGLNFVREDRKKGIRPDELILVEGYMDVIALGAAGITNVIAGMGTALTEEQITEIKKNTQKLLVCYDGDEAGRKATSKNAPMIEVAGIDMKIVLLPKGMDPDEVIKAEGAEGFKKYCDSALNLIEYRLKLCEEAYDLDTADGRQKYLKACIVALSDLDSPADIEIYSNEVQKKVGVAHETLIFEIERYKGKKKLAATPVEKSKEETKASIFNANEGDRQKLISSERFVLNRILHGIDYTDVDIVPDEWFNDATCELVIKWAKIKSKTPGGIVIGDIYSDIPDSELIDKIINEDEELKKFRNNYEKEKAHYVYCLMNIADAYLLRRIKELNDFCMKETNSVEIEKAKRQISILSSKRFSKVLEDKYIDF